MKKKRTTKKKSPRNRTVGVSKPTHREGLLDQVGEDVPHPGTEASPAEMLPGSAPLAAPASTGAPLGGSDIRPKTFPHPGPFCHHGCRGIPVREWIVKHSDPRTVVAGSPKTAMVCSNCEWMARRNGWTIASS